MPKTISKEESARRVAKMKDEEINCKDIPDAGDAKGWMSRAEWERKKRSRRRPFTFEAVSARFT